MRRQRLAIAALVILAVCAGMAAVALTLGTRSIGAESQVEEALAELAAAEARLDRDVLRVITLQLPHYDTVVETVGEIHDLRQRLADQLALPPYRGNSVLSESAVAYFAALDSKIELLERLKGGAAFLRNQVAYVPFAVSQSLHDLSEEDGFRLMSLAQQMLAYHASPNEEGRKGLVLALETAQPLADNPKAAPLLEHIRVYFEQRETLDDQLKSYSAVDRAGYLSALQRQMLQQHTHDQERMWIISALLGLFATGLLAALVWSISLLNLARRSALQASARLTDAIEGMYGAFALYDRDHNLVLCNSQYGKFYTPMAKRLQPGLPYEELLRGLVAANFMSDAVADPAGWLATKLPHVGHAAPWSQEVSDGRWYLCSHTPTADGGFLCLSTDLTAQKRAEEEARRLYAAVEQSPASIVITDTRGEIQYVNPWFCHVTGFAREEALGENPRILKSGVQSDEDYAALWRTIGAGEVWNGELCNKKKNGELYWESVSISPIRDGTGRVTSYVGVKRDITEQKAAEDRLQRTIKEMERSNAELEQFAYVVSHDLREPLRMVSSYVSLLARRYADKLDGDAMEFIAFAKDGARRMDRLILDLLEYSRIGRITQPPEPVSLREVLSEALLNLETVIQSSGASIEVLSDLPVVSGNRLELLRLLQNLLGNALKYSEAGRPPNIRLSVAPDGDNWRFTVEDNGIGIAPEYYERVFGIFQRLHARDEYDGTGIGLAICRKIVQHHGGRIWVESEPGQGSRFYFTLPVLKDDAPEAREEIRAEP